MNIKARVVLMILEDTEFKQENIKMDKNFIILKGAMKNEANTYIHTYIYTYMHTCISHNLIN